jgi:ribosomal-protein-alanine N-acetyltransferase
MRLPAWESLGYTSTDFFIRRDYVLLMKQQLFFTPTFDQFPELETEHLLLTEIKPKHAEDILRHFSNHQVIRYLDFTPMQSLQDASQLINFLANRFKDERGIRWGITLKGHHVLIGTCGYNSWAKRKRQAELGYDLGPTYWRRGIASEAVQAVLQFGFETMKLRKIEAFIAPENTASKQFIKGLGFYYDRSVHEFQSSTGRLARMMVFSLKKEQWAAYLPTPYLPN